MIHEPMPHALQLAFDSPATFRPLFPGNPGSENTRKGSVANLEQHRNGACQDDDHENGEADKEGHRHAHVHLLARRASPVGRALGRLLEAFASPASLLFVVSLPVVVVVIAKSPLVFAGAVARAVARVGHAGLLRLEAGRDLGFLLAHKRGCGRLGWRRRLRRGGLLIIVCRYHSLGLASVKLLDMAGPALRVCVSGGFRDEEDEGFEFAVLSKAGEF